MILTAVMAALGLLLIVVAIGRFGFTRYKSVFSPPGMLTVVGIGLIVAAAIYGAIQHQHAQDRANFNEALVKMFGRAPDRLELQGDDMGSFTGVATYDGKRYQLKTQIATSNDKVTRYQVIATSLDKPAPAPLPNPFQPLAMPSSQPGE